MNNFEINVPSINDNKVQNSKDKIEFSNQSFHKIGNDQYF